MMLETEFELDKIVNRVGVRKFMKNNMSVLRLARRIYRRTGSKNTLVSYLYGVMEFTKFMGYSNADELLASKVDWAAMLNDYIDYLLFDKKTSRSTIRTYVSAVKKWLKVNNVKVDGDVEVPQVWVVERDRIPQKEELRKLHQYGDIVDRIILLLGVSTGLRISTLISLKVGDVNLEDETPVVRVKPEASKERPTKGYITFMTPEAREHLLQYLDLRRKRGEEITEDSPLITWAGKHVSNIAISLRWERLLKRASLNERSRKWFKLRFHTLRKYFRTWTALSGVSSDVVEAFMGHISGIRHVYFLSGIESMENPEVIKILRKEYEKAIPHLTINTSEEMVKQLEEELEMVRSRQDEFDERLEKILKMINETIRYVRASTF